MTARFPRMRTQRGKYPVCCPRARTGARSGAALLEVILSLSLFVAAAAVILSSLSTSLTVAKEVRLAGIADDLSISLMDQMQLGMISIEDSGPQPCEEPKEDWTWQVVTTQAASNSTTIGGPALPLRRVELILRHAESGYVARTTQWFVDTAALATNSTATDSDDTGELTP